MLERSPKEIVGITSLPCSGARRHEELKKPVWISVDVSAGGERRVSCPFLSALATDDNQKNQCYGAAWHIVTLPWKYF